MGTGSENRLTHSRLDTDGAIIIAIENRILSVVGAAKNILSKNIRSGTHVRRFDVWRRTLVYRTIIRSLRYFDTALSELFSARTSSHDNVR